MPIHDLWVGLIKAPVFGLIVALTGCYQGMQVKANSEEVGLRTTAAVVHGDLHGDRARRVLRGVLHQGGLGDEREPTTTASARTSDAARDDVIDAVRPASSRSWSRALRNRFGEQVVHDDLDAQGRASGEILGVVGGSGTGKSVLMRSIIGLQIPDARRDRGVRPPITIGAEADDDIDIRSRWGVLFQGGALFSTLTVAENVEVPLKQFYPEIERRAAPRDRPLQGRAVGPARGRGRASTRPSCRAGCASAPASRARWRSIPSCCSSTSRPPGSTRSARRRSTS